MTTELLHPGSQDQSRHQNINTTKVCYNETLVGKDKDGFLNWTVHDCFFVTPPTCSITTVVVKCDCINYFSCVFSTSLVIAESKRSAPIRCLWHFILIYLCCLIFIHKHSQWLRSTLSPSNTCNKTKRRSNKETPVWVCYGCLLAFISSYIHSVLYL